MIMLICILAMRVREGLREWKKNNAAAIQQDTAVILVKELTRAPESPMARQESRVQLPRAAESRVQLPRAAATCTVSFATERHGVLTLDLTKAQAHLLHENERGLVRWQGSRFLNWQKQ